MKKDEDIINIIVDEKNKDGASALKAALSDFFKELPLKFTIVSGIICVCVIAAAGVTGKLISGNDTVIAKRFSAMCSSDKEYETAKLKSSAADAEVKKLTERLEDDKRNIEKFDKSLESLDKITQQNKDLEAEKASLEAEVASKQKQLDSLAASLKKQLQKTLTFTSGRYSVGTNIASGKYFVTGTGSIVISNAKIARVNKSLKSDGETYELIDGDIIEIDGNAKFAPE